jgi:formylglycine-generating enzyme required for sulfatase activity
MAHEVCFNGIDDDCNGTVDDGCPTQRSCMNAGTPGCGLVEVAAGGPFMMGEVGIENAEPVQPSITVTRPLAVDAYEVTVARFRAYWNAGHPAPGASVMYPSGALAWQGPVVEPTTLTGMSCNWTSSAGTLERHPINCIDWYTAQAFCVWDGGRLPTEAEMEWIARGRPIAGIPSPRTYPWGNTDPMGSSSGTCDLAQWHYCTGQDGQHTVHVGSFPPSGGIYDLVGNVAEYAADNFYAYSGALCWGGTARTDPLCDTDPSPTGGRPRRGGSFGALMVSQVGGAGRVGVAANFRGDYVGMRCVREH